MKLNIYGLGVVLVQTAFWEPITARVEIGTGKAGKSHYSQASNQSHYWRKTIMDMSRGDGRRKSWMPRRRHTS